MKSRLLVEGNDDKYSIINLMEKHGIDFSNARSRIELDDCGGFDELSHSLKTCIKTYHRLGIVIDADYEPTNRWESIRNRLSQLGLSIPQALPTSGLVVQGLQPNWLVGVWIMPNNLNQGMLECFLGKLIDPRDRCWNHVDGLIDHVKELGAPYRPTHKSKAKLHTWLAWQDPPGLPFGSALKARMFDDQLPLAKSFASWFHQVFRQE